MAPADRSLASNPSQINTATAFYKGAYSWNGWWEQGFNMGSDSAGSRKLNLLHRAPKGKVQDSM
jgi:hypothetical protein